ncbi:MAG: hypothetical protein ABWZ80_10085 [Beijerinckiaceae bacterium]
MSRRINIAVLIAMHGLSFAILGRLPRSPEIRGQTALEITAREAVTRLRSFV